MLIFHLQSGIWEFHFSVYVYSLWEMFWYIGNALDFLDLEVPGSSPGVSNNFFFLHFFWLFNDPKIENWPPNSSPWRIIIIYFYFPHFFV